MEITERVEKTIKEAGLRDVEEKAEKTLPLPEGIRFWSGDKMYDISACLPTVTSVTIKEQAGTNKRGRPIWDEIEKKFYKI
jgi:hypothetical protein